MMKELVLRASGKTTSKMREEFEAWYEGHCAPLESDWFKRDSDFPDDYDYFPAQEAWAGWKASRAALGADHSTDTAKMVLDGCAVLMTLDEAIDHANEKSIGSSQCAAQHAQLAKWLTDYRAMLAAAPKPEGGAA